MPLVQANYGMQEAPPWWLDYLGKIASNSATLAGRKYEPYRDRRVEPLAPESLLAQDISRTIGSHGPDIEHALAMLTHSANRPFSSVYKEYMNPYQQEVLNRLREEGLKTFNEGIMPGLENKFIRLGQHGSARHRQLAERGAASIQKEILGKQQEALAQHYNEAAKIHAQDQANQMAATRERSNVGILRQAGRAADIQGLQSVGLQNQEARQNVLNKAYQDFLEQNQFDIKKLQQHNAILQGLPVPSAYSEVQYTSPAPQVNNAGALGGAALNLLAARMMGGGGGGGGGGLHKRGGHIRRRKR